MDCFAFALEGSLSGIISTWLCTPPAGVRAVAEAFDMLPAQSAPEFVRPLAVLASKGTWQSALQVRDKTLEPLSQLASERLLCRVLNTFEPG